MSAPAPRTDRRGWWVAPGLLAVPVAFLLALFVWPLAVLVDAGLRPDGRLDLAALGDVLGDGRLRGVVWFTAWQAVASTVLTLIVGLPGAWAFARLRFRGRRLAWSALVVPFVLPTVVVGAAFLTLLGADGPVNVVLAGLGLGSTSAPALEPRGSVWVVVAAHVFFNVAVVIRVVGGAWRRLDPRLEDCAAALGAGRWRTFAEVTVPLLAPAVVAAASIVALFSFTSFGVVLLLGRSRVRTLEVEIFQQARTLDLAAAASLALVQLVVVVVLLVAASRLQRRWAVSLPARPEAETAHRPRSGGERWALRGVLAMLAVVLGAPLLALVARSLRVGDDWGLGAYTGLAEAEADAVLFVSPLEAARTSLVTAAGAATISIVIGGLTAVGLAVAERRRAQRHPSSPRRAPVGATLLDAAVMLPLGTSAVTIGFGFVLALDEPPLDLRGSPLLVPLAQALVAVPFVVRSLLPALRTVQPQLRDAAAVLGASPARVWRHVDLPLVVRPAVGAFAFALAISMGEFGATVFVARADAPTLPLVVERLLGQPGEVHVAQAMAVATVLAVVTAAVVAAVELSGAQAAPDG